MIFYKIFCNLFNRKFSFANITRLALLLYAACFCLGSKLKKEKTARRFEQLIAQSPFNSQFYQLRWLAAEQKKAVLAVLKDLPPHYEQLRHKLGGGEFAAPGKQADFVFRIVIDQRCSLCKNVTGLYWELIRNGYTVDIVSVGSPSKPIALNVTPKKIPEGDRKRYKWRSLPAVLIGSRKSPNAAVEVKQFPISFLQLEKNIQTNK